MKRFWKGKKRIAKKHFKKCMGPNTSRYWNHFYENGLPKKGTITHNCDGSNHRMDLAEVWWFRPHKKAAVPLVQAEYSKNKLHGFRVCPCQGMGYQFPIPASDVREYIEKWGAEPYTPEGEDVLILGKPKPVDVYFDMKAQARALKTGKAEVDEDGIFILKEEQ